MCRSQHQTVTTSMISEDILCESPNHLFSFAREFNEARGSFYSWIKGWTMMNVCQLKNGISLNAFDPPQVWLNALNVCIYYLYIYGFPQNTIKLTAVVWWDIYCKVTRKWDAYLCITPPALREAEYLQSAPGTLGCKKRERIWALSTRESQYHLINKSWRKLWVHACHAHTCSHIRKCNSRSFAL